MSAYSERVCHKLPFFHSLSSSGLRARPLRGDPKRSPAQTHAPRCIPLRWHVSFVYLLSKVNVSYASFMRFDWAPTKAAKNVANHEVAFEEVQSVFGDPLATAITDPDHSVGEE